MLKNNLTANILGVLSVISAIVAFSPSLLNIVKRKINHRRLLLQTARMGLIITVCLALIHGLLMTQLDNINFYNINTYWSYALGLFAFNLIVFFACTFSEVKLDDRKLNYFSYAALLLLIFHVGQQIIPTF